MTFLYSLIIKISFILFISSYIFIISNNKMGKSTNKGSKKGPAKQNQGNASAKKAKNGGKKK